MARAERNARCRARRCWGAAACSLLLILLAAAPASAASGWLKPIDLSLPGRDARSPVVGMDGAGNTIAMWERENTTNFDINLQISTRTPGTAFTGPADFLKRAVEPRLVETPGGSAAVIWRRLDTGLETEVIEGATRPPGGAFSAPFLVYQAPPKAIPQDLDLAFAESGAIAVSWTRIDPTAGFSKLTCGIDPKTMKPIACSNPSFVEATVRPAGGTFSAPTRVSPPRGEEEEGETEKEKEEREIEESKVSAGDGRIAVDDAGHVVAVYSLIDDGEETVDARTKEGPLFDPIVQVSESGENAGEPQVGMDSAGNALVVWSRNDGGNREVQAATREAPSGSFIPLGDLSSPSGFAYTPALAVSPNGSATAVWTANGFGETFVEAASRPPGGGPFSGPVDISSGKDNPTNTDVAVDDAGSAVVAWSGANGADYITRATVRPAGGGFGQPVAISQSSPEVFHPQVAIDSAGDATAVWARNNGLNDIVQAAGYDGAPPTISGLSVPATAMVGQALSFSASVADSWPIGAPHFAFGDGSGADGNVVSHTYSKPGTYQTVVTVTDAGGTTATATGTTLVKARNDIEVGKLSRNRRVGTATLELKVLEPGTAVVTGKGIRKATVKFERGGTLKASLRPSAKGRKGLNRKGMLKSKLRISYSPVGGDPKTIRHAISLRKILD